MPRLRDLLLALRSAGPFTFLRRVWTQINDDNLLVWASSLAYSWLFAIFPFLIFLISLTAYVPIPRDQVLQSTRLVLDQSLSPSAADTIYDNINTIVSQPQTAVTLSGICIALFAASGGMASTMAALNQVYEVPEHRPFYIQRPLALGLTVVVTSLLLLVVALLPVSSLVIQWLLGQPWIEKYAFINRPFLWAANGVRYTVGIFLTVFLISIVYHFGPRVRQRFRVFSPGSVFTAAMWLALGLGFRVYVENFGSYDKTYGTVGGVAVLLLVFYLDALLLLIGAEINSEIDFEVYKVPRGSLDFRSAHRKLAAERIAALSDATADGTTSSANAAADDTPPGAAPPEAAPPSMSSHP